MNALEAFHVLDIRTGTIVSVEDAPDAQKPIYKITVDFGELGRKVSGAGLKNYYSPQQLKGKRVVAVVNFPPKQIGSLTSECMLLAALDKRSDRCVLLEPDQETANGLRVF